ncbi:Hypothetical protein, putative [Bodo saltans]|uniref:Uncharacterized protein n=1 Tax=Bodo saltans TaxID=75058 RepID=A0A0S4IWK6_BODSA|nr:Hypothetical protein, putative [Bodo saltans]|eukprot:CUG06292.1 Hypothetical protein, putative [Bodo saltans]
MWQPSPPLTSSSNTSSSSRVLVFGDSGVGKSLLLTQLSCLFNRGCADAPVDRLEPTIGYRVESVPIQKKKKITPPQSNPTNMSAAGQVASSGTQHKLHMIDLIEVGGNRSLVMGSGSRFQPLVGGSNVGSSASAVDAVMFVYDEQSPRSMSSLATWYRECVSAGVVQGCKAIALVGVISSTSPHHNTYDSPNSSSTNESSSVIHMEAAMSSSLSSGGSHHASESIIPFVKSLYNNPHQSLSQSLPSSSASSTLNVRSALIWFVRALLRVEHLFLFLCSCLLFGLGQTQVEFRQITPKEALAQVKSDARCVSTIEGLELGTSAQAFEDNAIELIHFLSHL